MKDGRIIYYSLSGFLSGLAMLYCLLVYLAGDHGEFQLGEYYLSGIPNYYLFYVAILPFVSIGVLYLALKHRYIRLLGEPTAQLEEKPRKQLLKLRKLMIYMALSFSVLVTINDAADKDHSLPPYAFALMTEQASAELAQGYACLKGWGTCQSALADDPDVYLAMLREYGFSGTHTQGFDSFTHWFAESSWLYKFESLLNFLAALIISFFVSQIFLLLIVKNHVFPATKHLVIWLLIITSFWLPTKIYASWYSHIGDFSTPPIFWFAVLMLILGALLVFFIKTERNQIYKYASVVAGLSSAVMAGLSWFKPEIFHQLFEIAIGLGWVYGLIFLSIFCLALYLVTDHFIGNYEQELEQVP
ncbi:MAG: hypothetical protein QNJ78_11325 [Gammaproteobacteria bacterium]|nr:hypothetical protein [Gammaproteobacteria bacterium]